MTAKQIETELRMIYPNIVCFGPIHTIAYPWWMPNYNAWWIETNVNPEAHRIIGEGRSPKKAWLEAWQNKDKYMPRKHNCPACIAAKHGVRSRVAFEYIGCEFDKVTVNLPDGGSTTLTKAGASDPATLLAVSTMVELAKKNCKK